MSHTDTIAEAVAVVVAQVKPEFQGQVTDILTNLMAAQYQLGYRDAMQGAIELVKSA